MKKVFCVILCLFALTSLTTNSFAYDLDIDECLTVEEMNEKHNEVRSLISQRSICRLEQYRLRGAGTAVVANSNKTTIDEIDKRLEELGVQKGTLSDLGFTANARGVEVPEATNEDWYLETYNGVIYHGIRYEVSVLTAQSKNTRSVLFDSKSSSLAAAPGIGAGTADYLRILVTAASGTVGTIAGSIYDAVCTTMSNISTTTVVENVSSDYDWQCDTMMHYVYVKRADSGFDPQLSYVYNEVNTLVHGSIVNVVFRNGASNTLGYIYYDRASYGVMNANANNLQNAVDSFLNYNMVMHSFVIYVTITGVGNKTVARNYVCQEVYPGLLY